MSRCPDVGKQWSGKTPAEGQHFAIPVLLASGERKRPAKVMVALGRLVIEQPCQRLTSPVQGPPPLTDDSKAEGVIVDYDPKARWWKGRYDSEWLNELDMGHSNPPTLASPHNAQ